MELRLYYTSDDRRVVQKVLHPVLVTDCSVYGMSDIYTPTLLVDYNSVIYTANMFEIRLFNRTYFLNNVVVDAGGRMIITGEIDVLETYSQEIKSLNCTVVRNENTDYTNLVDPLITFTPKRNVKYFQFPNTPFNARDIGAGFNYVLAVGGGYTT